MMYSRIRNIRTRALCCPPFRRPCLARAANDSGSAVKSPVRSTSQPDVRCRRGAHSQGQRALRTSHNWFGSAPRITSRVSLLQAGRQTHECVELPHVEVDRQDVQSLEAEVADLQQPLTDLVRGADEPQASHPNEGRVTAH